MSSQIHCSEDGLEDLTQALDRYGPRNDLIDIAGPVSSTQTPKPLPAISVTNHSQPISSLLLFNLVHVALPLQFYDVEGFLVEIVGQLLFVLLDTLNIHCLPNFATGRTLAPVWSGGGSELGRDGGGLGDGLGRGSQIKQ